MLFIRTKTHIADCVFVLINSVVLNLLYVWDHSYSCVSTSSIAPNTVIHVSALTALPQTPLHVSTNPLQKHSECSV